ncbi:MAG: T9SS type A sorting domain-containing protein [Ginsengibacter sp.]
MTKRVVVLIIVAISVCAVYFFVKKERSISSKNQITISEKPEEYEREEFVKDRLQYAFDIQKDPATGKIPRNILQREIAFAKTLPLKGSLSSGILTATNLNTYVPAGPENIGGRTRAMGIDKRFGTGNNKVILSGSVSGGIYRTADGGVTWVKVTPLGDIHNVTSIAQDPRPGFQDTWYAGGGEAIGNSASDIGAFYLGFGILKSTDNGLTWTRLTQTVTDLNGSTIQPGTLEIFDNVFDIVHKIIVSPVNGDVFIAGHRRLVRSSDGGQSFKVVFGGNVATTADQGQMDIVSTDAGRLYLAVNGSNPDQSVRGVWTSATGDINSWTRIAGGQTPGVDSLNGWRGNSYNDAGSKRILLALAPSQQQSLFAFYQNGLSQEKDKGAHPEADLFRMDLNANTYTNLSGNMPDFPGQQDGVDPLTLQGGYNMMVVVKPDNPNVVFVGGTNLYRSTDGFSTNTKTEWIGGYQKQNPITASTYPGSHADFHGLFFDPVNLNHAFTINDGGIQQTSQIMASDSPDPVAWSMVNRYQTLQYNYVAIDPASGQNNFFGGAQDNGSYFRKAADPIPNNQFKVGGGDGASASIASVSNNEFTLYFSSQFGSLTRDITNSFTSIQPAGATPNPSGGFGDFVTYFKSDFDNPENLYFANYNRIYRTTNASTVTSGGWTELTGVATALNPSDPGGTGVSIRAMEVSRGPYNSDHVLFIGTSNGEVYRLGNPRDTAASAQPVKITPPGLQGNVADIAANPNNDDELLVVVSNYGVINIFYTNNAKSSIPNWKNAEGNLTLPSIRSCIIVVKKDASGNPATEYYVGTSVGLYSTTNINASTVNWEREGNDVLGLASTVSLAYRPQDNTLLVGTHGNGMFYTSTGTPDFHPNSPGGPITGDSVFIQKIYPTITKDNLFFSVGNLSGVNEISVRIYAMNGQLVYSNSFGYQSSLIDVRRFASGEYIFTISSKDNKHRFTGRFFKF